VTDAKLSNAALESLSEYSFPGNVRELENIIERAFTLCEDNIIELGDLDLSADSAETGPDIQSPSNTQAPPQTTHRIAQELGSREQNSGAAKAGISARPPEQSLEDYLEEIERYEIEQALAATKWNRTAAAKMLGISFRALRYRLKKLELD
ncbi:helix-turn-helix domain-containing protein, partial [Oleiphilus sp. HI0132]